MSRLQKIIIFGALCNAFLLLLVPPYDVVAIDRRLMFDAFYPAFAVPSGRIIDLYLLFNAFAGLTVNAALAWLVLGRARGPAISPRLFVALRDVYTPLLTLEAIYLTMNALAFWLLVGPDKRAPAYEPGPRTMLEQAAVPIERAEEELALSYQDASREDEGKPS